MKNKIFAVLTVIILCLSFILPVSAANAHIFDNGGMITADAMSALEQQAQRIEDTYGLEVIVSLTDSVGDEGTYGYTEDLYNANAEGDNGIALTYNYGDNKYAFYCAGTAEALFPEDVQANTLWNAFAYTETYNDSVYAYLVALEGVLSSAPSVNEEEANNADELPEEVTEFVPVDRSLPLVVDNADVLTDAEESDFITRLEALGEKYDLEIGILTVDTYEGKDGQAYADDFYDYNGYGYGENDDGLMIVFNTGKMDGTRNITLTTHGTAIDYITDLERDVIFDMMIPLLSNGEYQAAFETFVSEADNAIDPSIPVYYIPLSVVIGFALAFIIVKIQASKLNTVRQKVDAADYVGNVQLTGQYDNFMYRDVKKSAKPKSSSGSGSSSTHSSSSGRTHGGGSRNF